jgi:hypothetical protein
MALIITKREGKTQKEAGKDKKNMKKSLLLERECVIIVACTSKRVV